MNKVDRIPSRMTNDDDSRIRMVGDTANSIRFCLMWEVELLHRFSKANVPQL